MEKILLAILPATYDVKDKKSGEVNTYQGANVFVLDTKRNQVSRHFVQEKNYEDVGIAGIKLDKLSDYHSVKTYLEENFGKLKLAKIEILE